MSVLLTGGGVIPSGGNRITYLAATGTQYIDTGFKPNQDTRVVVECEPDVTTSSQMAVFGARNSNSGQATLAYGFNVMTSTSCRSDYMGSNATISGSYPAGTRISVDMNKNICTVNGQTGTVTSKTGQTPYPLFLFNVNNVGTPHSSYGFRGKIFSCKVYDNGTLVRDFVPRLDSNGVPCLYDNVEKKYYYNAGSGAFTAG